MRLPREGDRVGFRVADIFLPESPLQLAETQEIEGVIVQFFDSGPISRAFASVEVHISKTVVVPVERLQVIPPSLPEIKN
jgi:hypothetical protein